MKGYVDMPRSEWEKLIDEWVIGRNAERDRSMLRRWLFDRVGFETLAEEFDLSVQRTKSIVSVRKKTLFAHLKKD